MTNQGFYALAVLLVLSSVSCVSANDFIGEYHGSLQIGPDSFPADAVVVAEGPGYYRINVNTRVGLELYGVEEGSSLNIFGRSWGRDWTGSLTDGDLKLDANYYSITAELKKSVRLSPSMLMPPPKGAVVLLPYEPGKGPDISAWENPNQDEVWKTIPEEGCVQILKGSPCTKQQFGDVRLHLEFRVPLQPTEFFQHRANSGVFFNKAYEVQVLDSFGFLPGTGDCGGIYKLSAPRVNASFPPDQWQTYDIIFKAPVIEADGTVTQLPRVTVVHNGILVQNDLAILNHTINPKNPHQARGPFQLQDHNNPMQYRNVWLTEDLDAAPLAISSTWKLATQAWTFRKFTAFEAIDKTANLGLKYIELYPGQIIKADSDTKISPDMSPEDLQLVIDKLNQAGLTVMSFGVTSLTEDEAQCRQTFEFAKKLSVKSIAAEPPFEALEMVDRLATEYGISVAIHNHPAPSRYNNPDTFVEHCSSLSKRIGCCADVGHWIRSGFDPVESLQKLQGRIIYLHFKDIDMFANNKVHDVIWGTGKLDMYNVLAELQRQGFTGMLSIEYEYNWDNSLPEISKSIGNLERVAALLGQNID